MQWLLQIDDYSIHLVTDCSVIKADDLESILNEFPTIDFGLNYLHRILYWEAQPICNQLLPAYSLW